MSLTHPPQCKKMLLSSALILTLTTGLSFAQSVPAAVEEAEEELINKKPTIDLSKIVVTAGGFEQDVKDAPASISVVSQQDLQNAPFRDVTDAIADVPGVVITGGGASEDISIRGMGSSYTLMMVDGKRQNSRATRPNSDGSGIEQGWIPPLSAIERIEVIRGPMSSRYGSDAMGGVVNIITKKITDKWMGSVRTEFTVQHDSNEGNTNSTEFYASGPIVHEKLGLQLFGKYSHRQADEKPNGSAERRMENIGGKLTFAPIQGQTFELEYGAGFQKRNSTSESKYKRNNISARYLGEFDNGIMAELLYAHEKNDNYTRKMIVKNTEISGNLIIPIDTHTITLGGQYLDEKLTDNNNGLDKSINKIERKSHALFIEDEWWILDNVALTAAMRYDHDENYGSHYSPRIYGVWNVNDTLTLKGGVSTGYKTPGIRQAVADWGHGTGGGSSNGVILGNPDLKPEKSTNYEIGFNFAPNDNFDINVTTFYTKFKDKLQNITLCESDVPLPKTPDGKVDKDAYNKDPLKYDTCPGPNGSHFYFVQTNQNIDSAELKGLELATRWNPIDEVTLKGSYTWTKTKQTSGKYKGAPLNRIPEHLFKIQADWQVTPETNLWTKVSYREKETALSRGGAKGREYSSYTMLDLGGSYQVNRDISIYAGVYNITNKTVDNGSFGKTLDGRRYWMGINVDF